MTSSAYLAMNDSWQNALYGVLKLGDIWVVDNVSPDAVKAIYSNSNFPADNKLERLMAYCGLAMEEFSQGDINPQHLIIMDSHRILRRLEELGLVEVAETKDYQTTERSLSTPKSYRFRITSKGLDTALRIQEHTDNQERSDVQLKISKSLRFNSSISVIISFIALFFTGSAFWFSDIRWDRLNEPNKGITPETGSIPSSVIEKKILKKVKKSDKTIESLEAENKQKIISIPNKKIKTPDNK